MPVPQQTFDEKKESCMVSLDQSGLCLEALGVASDGIAGVPARQMGVPVGLLCLVSNNTQQITTNLGSQNNIRL